MKHFDASIANNLCEFWLQMNGTSFLILDCLVFGVVKVFQIEKFIGEFLEKFIGEFL